MESALQLGGGVGVGDGVGDGVGVGCPQACNDKNVTRSIATLDGCTYPPLFIGHDDSSKMNRK